MTPASGPIVVIGVGNEFRRDDGVGPAVVRRLRQRDLAGVTLAVSDGEPSGLIELWDGAPLAVVVDAVRADPPHPGRVHRLALYRPENGRARTASSHGLGLGEAVALAQVLGRLPGRLVVYAVEAADLTSGPGLTPAVATAVDRVAGQVVAEIGVHVNRSGEPDVPELPGPGPCCRVRRHGARRDSRRHSPDTAAGPGR